MGFVTCERRRKRTRATRGPWRRPARSGPPRARRSSRVRRPTPREQHRRRPGRPERAKSRWCRRPDRRPASSGRPTREGSRADPTHRTPTPTPPRKTRAADAKSDALDERVAIDAPRSATSARPPSRADQRSTMPCEGGRRDPDDPRARHGVVHRSHIARTRVAATTGGVVHGPRVGRNPTHKELRHEDDGLACVRYSAPLPSRRSKARQGSEMVSQVLLTADDAPAPAYSGRSPTCGDVSPIAAASGRRRRRPEANVVREPSSGAVGTPHVGRFMWRRFLPRRVGRRPGGREGQPVDRSARYLKSKLVFHFIFNQAHPGRRRLEGIQPAVSRPTGARGPASREKCSTSRRRAMARGQRRAATSAIAGKWGFVTCSSTPPLARSSRPRRRVARPTARAPECSAARNAAAPLPSGSLPSTRCASMQERGLWRTGDRAEDVALASSERRPTSCADPVRLTSSSCAR